MTIYSFQPYGYCNDNTRPVCRVPRKVASRAMGMIIVTNPRVFLHMQLIMEDFKQFEQVFGSKADNDFQPHTVNDICHNRQALENELFIDRLLKTLGIDKGKFHTGITQRI